MINIASVLPRLSLAAGFISAEASRLKSGYKDTSGRGAFVDYSTQVNSFLSKTPIPTVAVIAIVLKVSCALFLIFSYQKKVYHFRYIRTYLVFESSHGRFLRDQRADRRFIFLHFVQEHFYVHFTCL